jgi:restriction endonuclease Mrr
MLPTYRDIERPLIRELERRGDKARPADRDFTGRSVYEALADHFSLTAADRAEVIYAKAKPRSKWENTVRYAVCKLKDNGTLNRTAPHGVWQLINHSHSPD